MSSKILQFMKTIDDILPLSKRELQRQQLSTINQLQELFSNFKEQPEIKTQYFNADEVQTIIAKGPREHYINGPLTIYSDGHHYLLETSGRFSPDAPTIKDRLAMSNPHINTIDGIQIVWNGVQIIRDLFGYQNMLDMDIQASSTKLIKDLEFKATLLFNCHQTALAKYAAIVTQDKVKKAIKGYGFYEQPPSRISQPHVSHT